MMASPTSSFPEAHDPDPLSFNNLKVNPSLPSSIESKAITDIPVLSLPPRNGPCISNVEQKQMFSQLEAIFQQAEEFEGGVGVSELRSRPGYDDQNERAAPRNHVEALRDARAILDQMWWSDSSYIIRAAEILADASREPDWRLPFGESGILDFFLHVASTDGVSSELLLHALRLIGNSCADRNQNRQLVLESGCMHSLVRSIQNPAVGKISIPVVYNVCVDFEPAQLQACNDGVIPGIIDFLAGPRQFIFETAAVLGIACRLLDLILSTSNGIDSFPDNAIQVLLGLATNSQTDDVDDYLSLINTTMTLLSSQRFQEYVLTNKKLQIPLSILVDSYSRFSDPESPMPNLSNLELNSPTGSTDTSNPLDDSSHLLSNMRTSMIQILSDISALAEFPEAYPLSSPLINSIRVWLSLPQSQLQICAAVMLGNIARADSICITMIHTLSIHTPLLNTLRNSNDNALLHATLSFLKNLAIPASNKAILGSADLIPILGRLWQLDSSPQLQQTATSLTRQLIISCLPNIQRLLAPLSTDPESPANSRTHLSLLLSLCDRSDQLPTRTEIARIVVAILRVLHRETTPSAASPAVSTPNEATDVTPTTPSPAPYALTPVTSSQQAEALALQQTLYTLHPDLARPLAVMVSQTSYPVVRSEGWFAFALMARTPEGAACVDDLMMGMGFFRILAETIRGSTEEEGAKTKDRDNALLLVSELLKWQGEGMDGVRGYCLRDLLHGRESGLLGN